MFNRLYFRVHHQIHFELVGHGPKQIADVSIEHMQGNDLVFERVINRLHRWQRTGFTNAFNLCHEPVLRGRQHGRFGSNLFGYSRQRGLIHFAQIFGAVAWQHVGTACEQRGTQSYSQRTATELEKAAGAST